MDRLVVLDFGGQYAHLIARRFRSLGYYTEIALPSTDAKLISDAKGIVFSGGPSSVYAQDKPDFNTEILSLNIPILGLCYGHQLIAHSYGGRVDKAQIGEFGFAELITTITTPVTDGISGKNQVWMSHSDEVLSVPDNFEITGYTKDCMVASYRSKDNLRFGFQFHAEVKDTPIGDRLFDNFAKHCKMPLNWNADKVLEFIKNEIKNSAKDKQVLLFLSGGVDSSVAFALLNETLGKERVLGLYINNGFMRKNETEQIKKRYNDSGYDNFIVENAEDDFLQAVYQLTDPQKKRMAVGETFLKIRDKVVDRLKLDENKWLLAQGTLYPDIIESGGTKHARVIKTHHNRVDGIQKLIEKGLVIEPLKDLYKDEVRVIGKKLGLNDELVYRHPFPGPGISINVLCSDGTFSEADKLQITEEQIQNAGLERIIADFSFKTYAIPVKSVGVQGDFRTYAYPAVVAFDDLKNNFPGWETLDKVSSHLTNNISLINRTILELYRKDGLRLIKGYCDKQRLDMVREADEIVISNLRKSGWYSKVFQHLTINIPYACSPGRCSLVLRPVFSEDVMTARFARLDEELLFKISDEIKKLDFIDGLYYDITNKPPATFGWE